MTLELNQLADTTAAMGIEFASQERVFGQLVDQAQSWLAEFADQGSEVQEVAQQFRAAIPTSEELNSVMGLPDPPARFTAIGADGSQIQPDRHGMVLYYLINIGSLVYRHGSGETPQPNSVPYLYYREDDLYDGALLVSGNLLDVRRDDRELEQLVDLAEKEPDGPVLALVDGTLIMWVLENLPPEGKQARINAYLAKLARMRDRGAALAAFTSRPRYTEIGKLLHLISHGGDVNRAEKEANPFERLPDRVILSFLPAGARSAIFVSPAAVNHSCYKGPGHLIHYFYVNVADEGDEPVIARIEVPAWVVENPELLSLVHGGVVAQSRIAGGFPYVLARADELAFISSPEREQLEEMVTTSLYRAGYVPKLSPKAEYKGMTRKGRWW